MDNPYKKFSDDFINELNKGYKQIYDVIIWIAEHTLTVNEYKEFVDKFSEKPKGNKHLDSILKEIQKGDKDD